MVSQGMKWGSVPYLPSSGALSAANRSLSRKCPKQQSPRCSLLNTCGDLLTTANYSLKNVAEARKRYKVGGATSQINKQSTELPMKGFSVKSLKEKDSSHYNPNYL